MPSADDNVPEETRSSSEAVGTADLSKALLRLYESRELIIQSIKDFAIFTLDVEGRVTTWNTGAEKIFGYEQHQIIGEEGAVLFTPEDRAREVPLREMERARVTGRSDDERWHLRRDGTRFFADGAMTPIMDEYGTLHGFTKICSDVTARKKAEEERAALAAENARLLETERQALAEALKARQAAQEANRMKDEFLAIVSHELRTPLNAIVGWAALLQETAGDQPSLAEGIEAIQRNSEAQARLIEDILDLARISSGKVQLRMKPADLCEVAATAAATVRQDAERRGIQLDVDCGNDAPVMVDADRMQQVFWNLLSNAIKFTRKGGRVNLAVRKEEGFTVVTVADNGQGIDPDLLPHIFDRFTQAEGKGQRRQAGLGLGLAIVRQLVELHGGRVQAASEGRNKGSTFTVRLPLAEAGSAKPAPREPARSSAPAGELAGKRILILDDDADARRVIETTLARCGAEVTLAGSVPAALEVLEADRGFDAVISDIGMPDEDGYVFARRMRAREYEAGLPRLPMAALTAFTREQDREKALAAGFDGFVSKPIRPSELVEIVAVMVHSAPRR